MAKKKFSREEDDDEQGFERTSVVPGGGRQGPPQQEVCYELIDGFLCGYEQVEHEVMATDVIGMGRLREIFQAWIVPRMPDPLPLYLAELDRRGYHLRCTYDGSQALFLRKRMSPEAMKCAQEADEMILPRNIMMPEDIALGIPPDCIDYEEEDDEEDSSTGATSVGAVIEMMRSKQPE